MRLVNDVVQPHMAEYCPCEYPGNISRYKCKIDSKVSRLRVVQPICRLPNEVGAGRPSPNYRKLQRVSNRPTYEQMRTRLTKKGRRWHGACNPATRCCQRRQTSKMYQHVLARVLLLPTRGSLMHTRPSSTRANIYSSLLPEIASENKLHQAPVLNLDEARTSAAEKGLPLHKQSTNLLPLRCISHAHIPKPHCLG